MKDIEEPVAKKEEKDQQKLEDQVKVLQNMDNHVGPNLNALKFTQDELSERLDDVERNLSKKIIGIENKIKDFDEIKKMNKLITRLQMEMNSKLNQETFEVEMATKIERNEFFEFINKNLVYRDKLKTLTAMIDNFEIRFNERMNSSHKTYE